MIDDNISSAIHQVNLETFAGYKINGELYTCNDIIKEKK